jgi:predicted Zn-dependent protease
MDRLAMLARMVEQRPSDPFPRYGLAMEYQKLGRDDEAWATFAALMDLAPDYVPSYLMAGNLLARTGRASEAAQVFERGIAAAGRAGDVHARSELEAARAALP